MTKPNIVVMLLDAARADHLSCYGYHRETTPFIDSIAESGTQYKNAYSNSIWSLPAYASLFTGKYPSDHGAVDWGKSINSESNLLVNSLNDAGYETHALSPHLLTNGHGIADAFDDVTWISNPNRLPYPEDPVLNWAKNVSDSNEGYMNSISEGFKLMISERSWQTFPNFLAYVVRQGRHKTKRWKDNGANKIINGSKQVISNATNPFFLFTNFVETHDPYRPPKGYIHKYIPDSVDVSELNEVAEKHLVDLSLGIDSLTERERDLMISLYDAEINYIDSKVRELVNFLKDKNEWENTVFVLCSDHGDLFGEWGIWGHQGVIHRDLAHVPLIINTPWEDSEVVEQPVELRQLAKYFANIAAGDKSSIPVSNAAIVEYHGWDCQISPAQWSKFNKKQKEQWGMYSASCFTNEWQYLIDASGDSNLYSVESISERKESSVKNIEMNKKLYEYVVQEVGNIQENEEEYRSSKKFSNHTDEISEEAKSHLEELGYL
jgi:arylsulfatase A-like enzyme